MISEQKAIDLANLILSMDLITPRGQAARALARDILGMSTLHPTPQVITTNGTTRVIPYDEPLFLLRGQDIVAPEAVRAWAKSARRVGADPEIIRSAESQATAMEAWRELQDPRSCSRQDDGLTATIRRFSPFEMRTWSRVFQ